MHSKITAMVNRARSSLLALRSDCSGVTAIEYGLIVALISIFTISWATFVGSRISSFFLAVGNGF